MSKMTFQKTRYYLIDKNNEIKKVFPVHNEMEAIAMIKIMEKYQDGSKGIIISENIYNAVVAHYKDSDNDYIAMSNREEWMNEYEEFDNIESIGFEPTRCCDLEDDTAFEECSACGEYVCEDCEEEHNSLNRYQE